MTTAHRPTFDPARGKEAARGEAYHQRLLPAYKTLKFRQTNQGAPDEQARRDLKAELLKAEAKHYKKPIKDGDEDLVSEAVEEEAARLRIEGVDAGSPGSPSAKRKLDEVAGEEEEYEAKKRRVLEENRDADADSESSESSDESEDEDEDEEDEQAELMRELAKIKAERAAEEKRKAEEQAKKDEEQREKDIALGNPLLNEKKDYGVKRRWDDDVVFKNQARGTEEKGKEKRFVNDLLRSDFHRKFMDKYVR